MTAALSDLLTKNSVTLDDELSPLAAVLCLAEHMCACRNRNFFFNSSANLHLRCGMAAEMPGTLLLPLVNKEVCATEVQTDQLNIYREGY